jgi:hypothetical protein
MITFDVGKISEDDFIYYIFLFLPRVDCYHGKELEVSFPFFFCPFWLWPAFCSVGECADGAIWCRAHPLLSFLLAILVRVRKDREELRIDEREREREEHHFLPPQSLSVGFSGRKNYCKVGQSCRSRLLGQSFVDLEI